MNKKILLLSAMALVALVATADAKRAPAPQQTTVLDPVPVAGTVVGSTVSFVRKPRLDRVLPLAGYYACAPFELVGARCR